jgi:hypothetical protein
MKNFLKTTWDKVLSSCEYLRQSFRFFITLAFEPVYASLYDMSLLDLIQKRFGKTAYYTLTFSRKAGQVKVGIYLYAVDGMIINSFTNPEDFIKFIKSNNS